MTTLSLRRKQIFLDIEREDGTTQPHKIVEMDGDARDAYLTELRSRTVMSGDAKGTIKDFKGMQSDLIVRCLFPLLEDGKLGPAYNHAQLQVWPATALEELFDMSQEINRLKKPDEAKGEAKNS